MVRVTAVIASHNGATYLPDTLAALRGQSRVPDQFIAVNAASTDETAEIFREQLPDSAVLLDAPEGGFGAALAVADDFLPAPVADIQDWIWIHHDDAAPDPQALAVLLEAAERSPSVVIAGCKQVEAGRERALVDVGLSVTRRAERLTMLELDEQDQGQHDGASDVFAVNSAGLLVRLDVWRELRGFDPSLPFVGDDVDLAWRARAAGYRVIVVPAARMIHEPLGVKARVDRTAQRRASSYLRLKHATSWAVPLVAISLILGGIGRFFSGVFAKDLPYGAGQLGASIAPLWHPIKLLKARRLAAKTRKVPRSVDKRAFASPADVAHIRRRNRDLHATQVAATAAPVASQIVTEAGTEDPAHATGGHDDFDALETAVKPSIVPALSVLTLLTLVMSFIGFRHLFGAPALVGGSLLPLSTSLNEAWHNVIDWWQNTGMGVASASDPFDALILAASAVTGGQPNFLGICIYFASMTLVIETGSADPESQAAPAVRAKIMNRAGETLDSMSAAYSTDELRGPLLTPERADATAADTQIRNVVGSIVTGNAADVRASLASLGVSFVVIDGIVDATDPLLSRVRSVPGLAEVGVTSAGWLWRVNPLDGVAEATGQPAASTANVRVLKANGDVEQFVPSHFSNVKNTNIPAGQNGRVVVLAQQRDSGWTASVNGHKLEAAVNVPGIPEWAQAFQLPAEGGTLEVHYESPWRIPVFIGGALILLVVLLLAIPLPKRQLARLSEAQRYRPELKAQPLQQPAEHTEEVPHDA